MSVRNAIIILFGAIPATLLALPLVLVFLPVVGNAISQPSIEGIGLTFVCLCGFWGVLALWGVGFGERGTFSMIGLCAGILAASILSFRFISVSDPSYPFHLLYLTVCSVLVSLVVLIEEGVGKIRSKYT